MANLKDISGGDLWIPLLMLTQDFCLHLTFSVNSDIFTNKYLFCLTCLFVLLCFLILLIFVPRFLFQSQVTMCWNVFSFQLTLSPPTLKNECRLCGTYMYICAFPGSYFHVITRTPWFWTLSSFSMIITLLFALCYPIWLTWIFPLLDPPIVHPTLWNSFLVTFLSLSHHCHPWLITVCSADLQLLSPHRLYSPQATEHSLAKNPHKIVLNI